MPKRCCFLLVAHAPTYFFSHVLNRRPCFRPLLFSKLAGTQQVVLSSQCIAPEGAAACTARDPHAPSHPPSGVRRLPHVRPGAPSRCPTVGPVNLCAARNPLSQPSSITRLNFKGKIVTLPTTAMSLDREASG